MGLEFCGLKFWGLARFQDYRVFSTLVRVVNTKLA